MRRLPTISFLACLLLVAVVRRAATIDVGTHVRLPSTAGQTIPIIVSGGDAVEGLDFNVMIADGYHDAPGGTIDGPDITALDITTGTIFATNSSLISYDIGTQVASGAIVTNPGITVPANGLLGTITITSVNQPNGSFPLILGSPAQNSTTGPTDFATFTPTIINGTLITNGTIDAPTSTTFTTGPFTTAVGTVTNKTGAGVLLVNGPQTHAAGAVLNINAGSAVFATDAGSSSTHNLTLNANVATTFNTSQHLNALSIGAGAKTTIAAHTDGGNPTHPGLNANVLVTPSLTIAGATDAWTGTLDLNNNKLIIQSGSLSNAAAGAKAAEVYNLIRSGFNGDAATAANNPALLWTGKGINSTTANLDPNRVTGIGMLQNNDSMFGGRTVDGTVTDGSGEAVYTTFGGQAIARNDIIVMYTYKGDIDLNGQVTPSDYSNIDAAFAQQQTTHVNHGGWVNGDFDYNGVITPNDYSLIDASFAAQGNVVLGGEVHSLGGSSLGSVTTVPEPSSLALLLAGIVTVVLGGRRRRMCCGK